MRKPSQSWVICFDKISKKLRRALLETCTVKYTLEEEEEISTRVMKIDKKRLKVTFYVI